MTIIHGDCVEAMNAMEPESVDAVCTDPPYGLGFMGKAWDHAGGADQPMRRRPEIDAVNAGMSRQGGRQWRGTDGQRRQARDAREYQAWCERWAAEMLRVAKPSAYLLASGGTRTVHRMTCAIEDAGWIVRDMLVWGYASGFPKSKAGLKPAWEPIVMARKPGPLRMLAIDACRIPMSAADAETIETMGGFGRSDYPFTPGVALSGTVDGTLKPLDSAAHPAGRWPANVILTDPIFDGGWDGVVGGGEAKSTGDGRDPIPAHDGWSGEGYGGRFTQGQLYADSGTYSRFFLIPKAARSDREPVLDEYAYRLHRERGECDKLRSWASVDLSRNEPTASTSPARATSDAAQSPEAAASSSGTSSPGSPSTALSPTATRSTTGTATSKTTPLPTSPSSTLSPTSASIPGVISAMASGGSLAESAASESPWAPPTGISVPRAGPSTDDADPATSARWSSRSVCGRCGKPLPRVGSHPTVKPVDLMRHLVRLVTPPGGIVLDPFLGSGTTAIAAEMEGFGWIGIEREAEYVAIAEARLNGTQKGLAL